MHDSYIESPDAGGVVCQYVRGRTAEEGTDVHILLSHLYYIFQNMDFLFWFLYNLDFPF